MNSESSAMVMNCAQTRRWVQRLLDGEELPADQKDGFKNHVDSCPGCRKWIKELHLSLKMLRDLSEPRPSAQFQARLMRALGLERKPASVWLRWAAGLGLGLSAAWTLLVLSLGTRLLPSLNQGITWLSKGFHFTRGIVILNPGLTGSLLQAGGVFLLAVILLAIMALLALRMMRQTRPATIGT